MRRRQRCRIAVRLIATFMPPNAAQRFFEAGVPPEGQRIVKLKVPTRTPSMYPTPGTFWLVCGPLLPL